MSFSDIFRASKIRKENELLKKELEEKDSLLTPELRDIELCRKALQKINAEIDDAKNELDETKSENNRLLEEIKEHKQSVIDIDEKVMLQDFGLYEPKYDFKNSEEYKERLNLIRTAQKQMIKDKKAVTGSTNWSVNGSKAQGNKMVRDMQKLLLRAFNSECDELIDKVTYSNYETACKRINSSYEAISKLGEIMSVAITPNYLSHKQMELDLAFEYRQMKQKEKEEQKELRAQMREEAKLQKEIEEERKKSEKEQNHYKNALLKLEKQLESAEETQKADLLGKKSEIESRLAEIEKSLEDIDYRAANIKAGYVYIISNIGAFGENVYKIGMTRRLDPTERIDELGDASVPFDFDIHAMIFSDDAPALEAALHKAFENKKLNMVNKRREFFNVTLDEIKEVVRNNYDKSVEFIDLPQAEQYRTSLKMKDSLINA